MAGSVLGPHCRIPPLRSLWKAARASVCPCHAARPHLGHPVCSAHLLILGTSEQVEKGTEQRIPCPPCPQAGPAKPIDLPKVRSSSLRIFLHVFPNIILENKIWCSTAPCKAFSSGQCSHNEARGGLAWYGHVLQRRCSEGRYHC